MKKIPIILGGMVTLGAVGASSFLFAQGLFKKIDLLGKKFVLKDSKKNYGVKISYYNFEKDGPGLFGNTEKENIDGYNALGKRLKKVMYHGPEIDQLNEIVFGDWKIIDETANGLYIPNTKQIFINIKTFEPYWNNVNLNSKDIIDSLTGVVVHEYGHHIMNTYNNSMDPEKDDLSEKDIYHTVIYGKKTRVMQGWNKKFVGNFKSALHYDDSNFYPKNENEFGHIEPDEKTKEKRIFSMGNGNDSDAFNLFKNSNRKEPTDITGKKAFFTNGVYDNKDDPVEELKNAISVFKSSQARGNDVLHYIYSMDELATRQMEQLMYHYPVKISDSNRWGRMVPRDVASGDKGFSLETFVSDLMRNYIIYSPNKAIWNKEKSDIKLSLFKDPSLNRNLLYMSDNVWGGSRVNFNEKNVPCYSKQDSTNESLKTAYRSLMGVNQSINQIYAKNPSTIYDSITENDSDIWRSEWLNKIKISGFIPKGTNYKGLVINGNKYEFSKNDSSQKMLLTTKTGIFSSATPETDLPKSYILNQFIDLNDLSKEEQIFWWDDKNNDGILSEKESTPMRAGNISKFNRLTTYRQFMPKNTFAKIDTKKDGVYLYKGGY